VKNGSNFKVGVAQYVAQLAAHDDCRVAIVLGLILLVAV